MNDKGLIKVKIALARGLKKNTIKEKKIAERDFERRVKKLEKYENI